MNSPANPPPAPALVHDQDGWRATCPLYEYRQRDAGSLTRAEVALRQHRTGTKHRWLMRRAGVRETGRRA